MDKDIQNDVKDLGTIKELPLDTDSRPAGRKTSDPVLIYRDKNDNCTFGSNGDEYSLGYSKEKGEIKSIDAQYHFKTNEEAKSHLQDIKDKYKYDVNIKDVVVSGSDVKLVFKEEALRTLSPEEVEQKYGEAK